MQQTQISLVPRCPRCGQALPYDGAPHASIPSTSGPCSLEIGTVPSDTVEYTIYCLYALYPGLFGRNPWTRWYVYDQLFFVNGNGFAWEGDGLVHVRGELPEQPPPLLSPIEMGREYSSVLGKDASPELWAKNLENQMVAYEHKPSAFYPLGPGADIFQIPNHPIHPSWLLATLDAIRMFWQFQGDNQPLREVYHLVRLYDRLCNRAKLALPDVLDPRMTRDLIISLRDIH